MTSKSYNDHMMRQSREYICDMCNKKFCTRETISKHFINAHSNLEAKFECETCHKRYILPWMPMPNYFKFSQSKWLIDFIFHRFKLQSLLRSHMYGVHRDKKRCVTCEICGKSFYAKFYLNKHLRTHTDKSERLAERTQCEHCGEWLMSKSGIYYHKQVTPWYI